MTPNFYYRIVFYYKNRDVCKKPDLISQELTELWPFNIPGKNSQNFEKIALADKNIENSAHFLKNYQKEILDDL